MLESEYVEWNRYLRHLDDLGCLCHEEECICLSDKHFEEFINKYYDEVREYLGECV